MVPNGWKPCALADITKWSSGGTPSKSNPNYWGGDIPWISAASMRGHYFSSSELAITELAVSEKAKMAEQGTLLLLVRGSMLWNKIPVGITTRRLAFNQDVKCLTPISTKLDVLFLLYWFLAKENKLMGMVTGTGIGAGKLDTNDLQSLDVFLPPLREQRKIAKILSIWDKAISTTEQLIDNSKQQKKALMQQLLTGKKRLLDDSGKPFEEEWERLHLADIAKIKKGKALSSKDLEVGEYPVIAGGKTSPYKHSSYTHEKVITVSASGAYAGFVAYHKQKIWASDCSVIEEKQCSDIQFIYQYLLLNQTKIYSFQSGGAQPHIYPKDIEVLKVNLPEIKEQQKIAFVLSNADKEIKLLEQQLADLKQEKKALMQQLLTGKCRVKVDDKGVA